MPNTKLILGFSLLAAACTNDSPPPDPAQPVAAVPEIALPHGNGNKCDTVPADLRTDLPWYGTNRDTLQQWVESIGCTSPSYDKTHRPVATFDWDNTISKNDFGDAMTYYFIAHGKVLQPPGQDWHATSPYLTDAAAAALTAACGTSVPAGQPLPTDTAAYAGCADEMLSIYDNESTRAGAAAFTAANARRMEPAYAWTPQLMAGYTHAQVQQLTADGVGAMLAAPEGTTQTIGTTVENGWLRIYEQQKDLIHVLQSRGVDVWIITASPQDVIQTFAPMAGVAADHVIGIRSMTDGAGKLTYAFEGCGDVADGQTSVIPYIQGKRCFLNKIVFGETGQAAWRRRPDGTRAVFAAGDSDSDVEFLRDATYKLVLNRNKADLMCHAYYSENSSWVVNPMFIGPKGAKSSPYACGTAFTAEDGTHGPSRDEGGNVIPDQVDSVHP